MTIENRLTRLDNILEQISDLIIAPQSTFQEIETFKKLMAQGEVFEGILNGLKDHIDAANVDSGCKEIDLVTSELQMA